MDIPQILRVNKPKWVSDRSRDRSQDHAMLGEQAEWAYALPWMYRLISADHPGAMMPTCPGSNDSASPYGYWAALWELLSFNLSWSQPAIGLKWWLAAGQPVEDRKLRLLRDIWWTDGQLDWFHAWLYENTPSDPERPPEQWFEQVRSDIRERGFPPSPFGGGSDPLHLLSHGRGPIREKSPGIRISMTDSDGIANVTLHLPGLGGWYTALDDCNRSARVRVLVPWIGEVGVFSYSARTGLWHSTTEAIHLAGNPLR